MSRTLRSNQNTDIFDYVIVGAGSAGCVLANRLTEDPGVTVLLLEAGGSVPAWEWRIRMPAALAYPMNGRRYSWDYHTEPEPFLGARVMHCPRGKVLGGSSSINGMVYIRGHAFDYDRWAAEDPVLARWDYRHCLPYFRKSETRISGDDAYHGSEGPLHVTPGGMDQPLARAFTEAARQAGYPLTSDLNGYQQEGFGPMDRTTCRGERDSTWACYLKPVIRRPNLAVRTHACATQLLFEDARARGVRYSRDGRTSEVQARREVILSGGPVNNPQLLMLSGIGPAPALQAQGISVRHDLPGVGANLQDHLELYVQMECLQPVSLYSLYNVRGKALTGLRWLLSRRGPGASNHFETGGFIRSRAGVRHPDLQYHFFPMAVRYDGQSPAKGHGFQAHVGPMRSRSTGQVTLRSGEPHEPPRILFNYLSRERDREEFRAAIRLTREIFAQAAMAPFAGRELAPGAAVQSDDEIDDYVRQAVESAYHPCGTCRMGSGPQAVVDAQCRVHGLDGLRIVDSSVMPSIVSGNLNAPTIMLAEKAADLIRDRTPLPAEDVPVYEAPDHATRQR